MDENWKQICKQIQIVTDKMCVREKDKNIETKCKIQSQLIQMITEIVFTQYENMKTSHIETCLEALENIGRLSRQFNLILQEREALEAYLKILYHMFSSSKNQHLDRRNVAEKLLIP